MAGLRDIKRRITSVKSTQKITKAMKMVAAAKLRRAQDAILATRPSALRLRTLVTNLAGRADGDAHPLLRRSTRGGRVELLVVTSDRGLCGAFNSNVVNRAMAELRSTFAGRDVSFTVVGRKGVELLRRRGANVRATHTGVMDGPVVESAEAILSDIIAGYADGSIDEVFCLYNEFKSAISQNVVLERVLPFESPEDGQSGTDYLYEPSEEIVFEALLVQHLQVQMHRVLFESAASEQGARMTAMDSATKNAGDMIDRLTLQYNRARQDAITKELIEVVSGAEAL